MNKVEEGFLVMLLMLMTALTFLLILGIAVLPPPNDESLNEIMQRLENINSKSLENANIKIEIEKK